MKYILILEEAFMLLLSIVLNSFLPFEGWLYWVLFLCPDLGMLGYLISPRLGSITYNSLHHKGIALVLYIIGIYFKVESLQFAGLLLFGHSSFDRMLGYGLKFPDSFHHTHLGWIGRATNEKQL